MQFTAERLLIVGVTLTASFLSQSALSQEDFSSAVERVAKSVVVIKGNSGLGSGFIVSPDGKIATNLHVLQGMTQGGVQLANGEIFDSFTILGVDARRDLAVIKIGGFNLPTLELGDSDAIRVGERLAAVGSPRGLSGSVTTGVLSAIRPIEGQTLLQIDASVNPGNSGGPVIRLDGKVVGVVVSKLKAAENLNFAIPVNALRGLLGNLTSPITLSQMNESLRGQTDVFSAPQEAYPREWRSLQSANSRRLNISSDAVTGANHIPAEAARWGVFARWDINKRDGKWIGKTYSGGRCLVPANFFRKEEINNCSFAWDVELSLVTPTRIEGWAVGPVPGSQLDCSTCTYSRAPAPAAFVWVPAD